MARAWNRLSANFVRGAKDRGRYHDGGGLVLQVAKGGTGAWVFQYERGGERRAMGLGSRAAVPLALARELAQAARESLARGVDPIDARKAALLEQRAARARMITFEACAEFFFEANQSKWRNEKHRREWHSAVKRFAYPMLGHLACSAIDSGHVTATLQPLLTEKHITALRLRGRIEVVLDFAIARGWRSDENPATKKVIGHLLPLRSEKANVTHQPALPFDRVPAFMKALRATEGVDARFLELIVLSGMRSETVRQARFEEFDLDGRTWAIAMERMKTLGREHRIPLTDRMVQIVKEQQEAHEGPFVFGGASPIVESSARDVLPGLLTSIGYGGSATPHGFRSSLKDWAHETRDYPTEVIEQALGHRIKSSVERAYRRGDLFARRKVLMADWESYCFGLTDAKVVKLRG